MTNAKSPNPLTKFLDKWRKQFPNEDEKAFGVVVHGQSGSIDDGNYGDPMRDDRPQFVKDDEVGWQRLGR
jgi:hypothetical protein